MAPRQLSLFASLLALLLVAFPGVTAADAAAPNATTTTTPPSPTVYDPATTGSSLAATAPRYHYQGCIREITDINGTAPGARALQSGTSEVLPGAMTVPECLAFCGGAGGSSYPYAGLEYARECWCGRTLSVLATAVPAADCNLPCDGDNTTLCGGSLRLSLYVLTTSTRTSAAALGQQAVGVLTATLAVGAAALLPFL